jgi:surface polysaccharide O-acyltransferase-like enzyme
VWGGGKRLSNIELLRIVSMALVLLIHFALTFKVTHQSLVETPIKSIVFTELHSLSIVCANCFILISGYFGIRWKIRSFCSLIYQILFWLALGYLINEFLLRGHHIGIFGMMSNYFGCRWFVPAYLALYIVSPMLNSFIEMKSNKQLGLFILIFYLYSTIVGYLLRSSEFNEGMSAMSVVGLYLIGAYLRRSNAKWLSLPGRKDLAVYVSLSIFLAIVTLGLKYYGIEKSPIGYLNPIVILMTVYLFLFFKKLNIKSNKAINYIATSAFAVFLFHYQPAMIEHYTDLCKIIIEHGLLAILLVPLFFAAIFTFCVLVDRIRIYSFNSLNRIFQMAFKI